MLDVEASHLQRFADQIDLAQYHIDQATEIAIAQVLNQTRQSEGRQECVDCGGQIPVARLAHVPNARRCTECQHLHERQRAIFFLR